jgi:hypothetical protein
MLDGALNTPLPVLISFIYGHFKLERKNMCEHALTCTPPQMHTTWTQPHAL